MRPLDVHKLASWLATAMLVMVSPTVTGCTKRNPDICCDSVAECTKAGFDANQGLAHCEDGVCVNYTCVASGCDDDGDCHDPAHPTCVSGQCYGAVDACREGGGARIIFVSTREEAPGLYSMYVNGSGQKRIASTPSSDRLGNTTSDYPAMSVSMDGSVVAFIGEDDAHMANVFAIGSDGNDLRQITTGDNGLSHVEWSPDGMKLVASTPFGVVAKAFVVRADGSHQLLLTGYSQSNYDPSWSPDSTKIVFASANVNADAGIWTAADNAASPASLDSLPDGASGNAYRPRWSPDGSVVAYLSGERGGYDLVFKKFDGMPGKLAPNNGYYTDLRWSHDGTHLLVSQQNAIPGPHTIWVMNADGTNLSRLTDAAVDSSDPRWSLDDQSILFDTNRDGDFEIYRMDADGSNPVNLTKAPGLDDALIQDYGAEWASCPSS